MRRSLPFIICVGLCTLATGMTLIALAQEVSRPPVSGSGRSSEAAAANVDLVRRFYTDVAAVLASGDADLLDARIAPDLTEHPARLGAATGGDGFVRALLALRATFPGLRLVVDDVRAAGKDQVLVRVHPEGAWAGVFLGRPVPASLAEWGPLEVWRIADGKLVERWGGFDTVDLVPLGQVPLSIDALGPGDRRMTVTHMNVVPGAAMVVDNGQAVRVFAVDAGTLTVKVGRQFGATVTVARGSATPTVARTDSAIAAATGDVVVTSPEADYTLTNDGLTPAFVLVVIVSNIMDGEWPMNSSAAAAAWTVAAMPQALGGALPSPTGFSARTLAADVGIEMLAQPILAFGWMFLAPGATVVLPAGDGTLLAAIDDAWGDPAATGGTPVATLGSGKWKVVTDGVEGLWQSNDALVVLLMLTVRHEETTS